MSGNEAMRELGRKGGKASAEARRKPRSPLEVLRRRFRRDPEGTFDEMSRTVYGMRLLERLEEDAERPQPGYEVANPEAIPRGFADLVRFAVESRQERLLLGFELTDEQRAQVLAGDVDGGSSSHVPARTTPVAPTRAAARASQSLSDATGDPNIGSPPSSAQGDPEAPLQARTPTFEDELAAAYRRERAQLGLPPDPGGFERPDRPPDLVNA